MQDICEDPPVVKPPTLLRTAAFFGVVLLAYLALTGWEKVFEFDFGMQPSVRTSLLWTVLTIFLAERFNLLGAFVYAI